MGYTHKDKEEVQDDGHGDVYLPWQVVLLVVFLALIAAILVCSNGGLL